MSKFQYFYILKNESLSQDWVKVMTSDKPLSNTSEELKKTELPTPFTIVAGIMSEDISYIQHYFAQEYHITTTFKFGSNKDFINISADVAIRYLIEASLFLSDCELLDLPTPSDLSLIDNLGLAQDLTLDQYGDPQGFAVTVNATSKKSDSAKSSESHAATASKNITSKSGSNKNTAAEEASSKAIATETKKQAKAAKASALLADAVADDKDSSPARLPSFKFSLIGLKPGDEIIFAPLNIKVRIVDERHIKYRGREYSTSRFCRDFLPEDRRKACNTYRGPDYFTYKGKTLTEIRNKLGV